ERSKRIVLPKDALFDGPFFGQKAKLFTRNEGNNVFVTWAKNFLIKFCCFRPSTVMRIPETMGWPVTLIQLRMTMSTLRSSIALFLNVAGRLDHSESSKPT